MGTDINAIIGANARRLRREKKLSMRELSELLPDDMRITEKQLANYETGKCRWPADLLFSVQKALRADIRHFLQEQPQ